MYMACAVAVIGGAFIKMATLEVEDLLLAGVDGEDLLLFLLPGVQESTYDATKPKFNLQDYSNAQCRAYFRFDKQDIYRPAEQAASMVQWMCHPTADRKVGESKPGCARESFLFFTFKLTF